MFLVICKTKNRINGKPTIQGKKELGKSRPKIRKMES